MRKNLTDLRTGKIEGLESQPNPPSGNRYVEVDVNFNYNKGAKNISYAASITPNQSDYVIYDYAVQITESTIKKKTLAFSYSTVAPGQEAPKGTPYAINMNCDYTPPEDIGIDAVINGNIGADGSVEYFEFKQSIKINV